jgi:hypothetical protein
MGREAVRVLEQFRRGQVEGPTEVMAVVVEGLQQVQVDCMVVAAAAEEILMDRADLDILVFLRFANFKGDQKWNFLYK